MGLISTLRKKLSPYINLYNYRTGALQQIPLTVGQPAVYPTSDIANYIKAYTSNASVYTIISTIASKFGYMPRYVYEIEDEDAAEDYQKYIRSKEFKLNHALKLHKKAYGKRSPLVKKQTKNYGEMEVDNPLSDLLNNPNPLYGQDEFFELIDIYYESTGECFIWLNRGGIVQDQYGVYQDVSQIVGPARLKLPVEEMYVLPSQFMAMNVDRATYIGDILNYIFIRNGVQIPIPKEDIIHWRMPNPNYDSYNFTHLRGLSPLSAGLKLYTGDDAAMDAMVAMQQNDGAKGVLFNETMNNLKPEQLSAARDAVDNKVNNRNLKSAVSMLPGKWDYLYMGQNAVDMDLIESQDKMFSRLCNLYRVNPNFFLSGQTFDNLSQARKDFITQTVMPRVCSNRDKLNQKLLVAFGLNPAQYTIDVDITNLPEMMEDIGKLGTALTGQWWLTGNEKRQELNMEESDDPDMDKFFLPNNLMPLEDAASPMGTLNAYGNGDSESDVSGAANGLQAGAASQGGAQGTSSGQNSSGSRGRGGKKPK